MKKSFRHTDFPRADAVAAAVEALVDAADEDRATGGFDVNRQIYPILKVVTETAVEEIPEAEIVHCYEQLMEKRKGEL